MLVTELGIVIEVKLEQLRKVILPMLVNVFDKVTEFKLEQF
jgi:hypothetical protein